VIQSGSTDTGAWLLPAGQALRHPTRGTRADLSASLGALLPGVDEVRGRAEKRSEVLARQPDVLQILEEVGKHSVVGHAVKVDIEVASGASLAANQRGVGTFHLLPLCPDGSDLLDQHSNFLAVIVAGLLAPSEEVGGAVGGAPRRVVVPGGLIPQSLRPHVLVGRPEASSDLVDFLCLHALEEGFAGMLQAYRRKVVLRVLVDPRVEAGLVLRDRRPDLLLLLVVGAGPAVVVAEPAVVGERRVVPYSVLL
jgi:hypothetical protein